MLEFVFVKYKSQEIESALNPDSGVTPLMCGAPACASRSRQEDVTAFNQLVLWRENASPFFFLLGYDASSPASLSLPLSKLDFCRFFFFFPSTSLWLLATHGSPSLFHHRLFPSGRAATPQTPAALTKWRPCWEQPPLLAWVGDERKERERRWQRNEEK